MSPTELRDVADSGPAGSGTDVLALAPRPVDRRLLRGLLVGVVVLALAVAGFAVWRSRQPPPDLTLDQLQGAYTGMVRSDGTNDVSTITAANFTDPPLTVQPQECAPLFATTVSNQFPVGALDGVSTYWLDGPSSVSLFTVRYPDPAAAEQAYAEVTGATRSCDGRRVQFSGSEGPGSEGPGTLSVVAPTPDPEAPDQVVFVLNREEGRTRYALHVLRLDNTVTWQYRYQAAAVSLAGAPRLPAYDPAGGRQLLDGLVRQLRSIQAGS